MSKVTGKAQAGTQAQGKAQADSKRKPTTEASKASKADSKPDKVAGRAEAEAKALTLVGEVKSHTGGRINLDSVRVCPRKGGKVKAFLRPTYECPQGVTLTPYEAGGFTGFTICDLTTEAGRQTLAALIAAKRKPTAADKRKAEAEAKKAADKATAGKASKGQAGKAADSKPASKGKADKAQASKPAGKASKGKAAEAGKADSKPTA